MTALDEQAAARRRHPCARSPVDPDAVERRMAAALRAAGAPWPEVGASLVAARARSGLGADAGAARLGTSIDVLQAAEAGEVAPASLPVPLRRLLASPEAVR